MLVEKEWLDFGHKFADRNGSPFCTSDLNERSPIFLQVSLKVPFSKFNHISLNYIKQLGFKEDLRLKRGFSMETLCPHEYDIPLVSGGHLEGPHVFGFLMHVFPSEIWTKT